MRIAAIDPGCSISSPGALAVLEHERGKITDIQTYDLPVLQRMVFGQRRSSLDLPVLALLLHAHGRDAVFVIEETHGGKSLVTAHQMGETLGACKALACVVADGPIVSVRPKAWKSTYALKKDDKESSRRLALRIFPQLKDQLNLKKHHNRAEAALLAYWGMHNVHEEKHL